MVHHNVCPLCSSEKIFFYLKCTDNFISKETFDIYKCQTCNFEFTQDAPGEFEISKYYESDDYISHSDTSRGLTNKIYRFVRNIMLCRKRELIKDITGRKKGTLLDIGSGTGYFASTMLKAGWDVSGIEINEKARDFSKIHFGLKIFAPEQILTLKYESFDCITLWHVLEHFHNPFKYISDISRLLKPGGLCIIALPNCDSYDANFYKKAWAAYDVPRHLWHFNPATFRIFSEKAGFTLGKLRSLPFDVFYISIMSEKYQGSRFPFLKGIITALPFAFLSLFNKKRSSSVIYILRKPIY